MKIKLVLGPSGTVKVRASYIKGCYKLKKKKSGSVNVEAEAEKKITADTSLSRGGLNLRCVKLVGQEGWRAPAGLEARVDVSAGRSHSFGVDAK